MPTSSLFEALALRADVGIGPYKKSRQGRWPLHTDYKRAALLEPLVVILYVQSHVPGISAPISLFPQRKYGSNR